VGNEVGDTMLDLDYFIALCEDTPCYRQLHFMRFQGKETELLSTKYNGHNAYCNIVKYCNIAILHA